MKPILPSLFVPILLMAPLAFAHEGHPRSAFVSDASHVVGTYKPKASNQSPTAMADAGMAFLNSLDDQQRKAVSYPLDDPERKRWTNLPQRRGNGGLALGKCNEMQIMAFCDLLATMLSEQGYQKTCNIMLADDQLLNNGQPRAGFGTEDFFVVIFGKPSPTDPWGFQLDGHHLGLNLSIEGESITFAPSFIGTQPEIFNIADHQIRPLAGENDLAFKLVNSLTEDQKATAILSNSKGNLRAGPGQDAVPEMVGIKCESLNEQQKSLVLKLIALWVNDLPQKQAEQRMEQLAGELNETRFGWRGSLDNGNAISYSIQGPTLIIEYAAQDARASHIHTIYRDPSNPYGKQFE
ncbi:MAG: DUF3500 domain-containing protein [Planctomycetota bacterium]